MIHPADERSAGLRFGAIPFNRHVGHAPNRGSALRLIGASVPLILILVGVLAFSSTVLAQRGTPIKPSSPPKPETSDSARARHHLTVTRMKYHGWSGALHLSNGQVEAVVVPAIGRVVQFNFVGEDGPFWENRNLDAQLPDSKSKEWRNFGGDKTWPSPQADWGKVSDRDWPPPPAFDSMLVAAKVNADVVVLTSPVDPFYGLRITRRIQLAPGNSIMTITTLYEKVEGSPKKVGVWTITQLKDPVGAYLHVPNPSLFPEGYNKQSDKLPPSLKVQTGLLSLTRDAKTAFKIGSDAGVLLWAGQNVSLRIDSPRESSGEFPNQSSSAEIYTNPDPLTYIELEMLGPLLTLKVSDKIQRANTYTLLRRTTVNPESEARKILAR